MYEAEPWGITYQKAEDTGVVDQFECAQGVFAALRKRGLRVLVGGDYGFPWTPHGTNARDLEHFVRFLGYSDSEALVAATRTGAAAMMLDGQAGEIVEGLPCRPAGGRRRTAATTCGCCRRRATSSWS